MQKSAIVIGAGIVGLAVARALAIKGYSVSVFERSQRAIGASIRNFGMIWPIGQPSGKLYERALRSRNIWKEMGDQGVFWYDSKGSLHVAHEQDEWNVLEELYDLFEKERPVEILSPRQVAERSGAVVQKDLKGALFSGDEILVDPREAIAALPQYLHQKFDISFHWGESVQSVQENGVYTSSLERRQADVIFLCSGTDMETLYPDAFLAQPLTTCKLQMMRLVSQLKGFTIGPALCGGLSLIHYNSFKAAGSLQVLKQRYERDMKEYLNWGIHVMVAQNSRGELTIGDSHEYGPIHDPFDKNFINTLILSYLQKFAHLKPWSVIESWHGLYTKHTLGEPHIFISPAPGVYILNALGGAGMTLSFGLAEEVIASI